MFSEQVHRPRSLLNAVVEAGVDLKQVIWQISMFNQSWQREV